MAENEVLTKLEQLEQELPRWDRAACLPLLGLLERLKALAWVQIVGSPLNTTTGPEPDRLLTLPEVAERLAIPTGHAYDLARRDILPVVRFGKYVRVSAASLTRWIAQQTTPQRRIDNEHLGFHSGAVTAPRQTRGSAKARPTPGPAQRARTRAVRIQPQSEPNRLSQVKPAVEEATADDLISDYSE
jgi:excisionase family DNA binding protein